MSTALKPWHLKAKSLFIVTRKRSYIGLPSKFKDACLKLGLTKLHHTHLLKVNPLVMGNLTLLRYLVSIKYVTNGPFPVSLLQKWLHYRGVKANPGFYVEQRGHYDS